MEQEAPHSRPSPKVRRMNVDGDVSASASHEAAFAQEVAIACAAPPAAADAHAQTAHAADPETERGDAARNAAVEPAAVQHPTADERSGKEAANAPAPAHASAPSGPTSTAKAHSTAAAGAPSTTHARVTQSSNAANAAQPGAGPAAAASRAPAYAQAPPAASRAEPPRETSFMSQWNEYFYKLAQQSKWSEICKASQRLSADFCWSSLLLTEPDVDVVVHAWHALSLLVLDQPAAPLLVRNRAEHPLVDALGHAILLLREQPRRKGWGDALYSAMYEAERLLATFSAPANVAIIGPNLQGACSTLLAISRFAHFEVRRRCLHELALVHTSLSVAELVDHLHMGSRAALDFALRAHWTPMSSSSSGNVERLLRPKQSMPFSSEPCALKHILLLTDQVYALERSA